MSSPITPLTVAEQIQAETDAVSEGYFRRVLIALDMFGNVLLFNGMPGETISAHAGRAAFEGHRWGLLLCKFLDLFEADHDIKAEAADLARAARIVQTEESSADLPVKGDIFVD